MRPAQQGPVAHDVRSLLASQLRRAVYSTFPRQRPHLTGTRPLPVGTSSVLLALVLVAARGAAAQGDADRAWGFVSLRYSSATADFLFAGYGHGPAFGVVGMVNNPRSGYTEIIGGVGTRFALGAASTHAIALTASRATESWYSQLYYLPTITLGRLKAEATFQLYMPGGPEGVKQIAINPVSLLVPVARAVSVGASYQLAAQERDGPSDGAGPSVHLAVPRGTLSVDLMKGLRAFRDEVRVSFRAFF